QLQARVAVGRAFAGRARRAGAGRALAGRATRRAAVGAAGRGAVGAEDREVRQREGDRERPLRPALRVAADLATAARVAADRLVLLVKRAALEVREQGRVARGAAAPARRLVATGPVAQ